MDRVRGIVVVGGGISGFSAAAALARGGIEDITLLDNSNKMPHADNALRAVSARDYFGYTLWPAATRTLEWLGLGEGIAQAGCRLESMGWYDGSAAETLSLRLDELGHAGQFTGIRPSALHELLEGEARRAGVEVLDGVRSCRIAREHGAVLVRGEAAAPVELRARLVLACDGADSPLRRALGIRVLRWRPPRQLILTGVGGCLARPRFDQVMGAGRARGCVALGAGGSWLYSVLHGLPAGDPLESLRAQTRRDPWIGPAANELERVAIFRPWSVRVTRWARDRVLLVGDAAHAMLPHVGLGGSTALEGMPLLAETILAALAAGDLSAERLEDFRRRRRERVAHAQRVSEAWALATTAALPGLERLRDAGLRRVAVRGAPLREFVEAFAAGRRPGLATRLRLCLP